MTYPQTFPGENPFEDEPLVPEWPVDPERAFIAFIAASIVLIASAGAFVLLFIQPPW